MPEISSSMIEFILWGALAYLAGSIPFGLILSQILGLGNLREIGSGNIGATNVLRTGSKKAALLTLLLDAGKGFAAVYLAQCFGANDLAQWAAICVMIGHCFPVWLGFRGGKGVATFLGVIYALSWQLGLALCAIWLLVAILFRYSSLAALISAAAAPAFAWFFSMHSLLALLVLLAIVIFWRHSGNIVRLLAGTEHRIGRKNSE